MQDQLKSLLNFFKWEEGNCWNGLEILVNRCFDLGTTLDSWRNANVVIMYKKGNKKDLKNYRPILLLSHLYKLLTEIINNRITTKLDAFQPPEPLRKNIRRTNVQNKCETWYQARRNHIFKATNPLEDVFQTLN